MTKQVFKGAIYGQVAGGDIINNHIERIEVLGEAHLHMPAPVRIQTKVVVPHGPQHIREQQAGVLQRLVRELVVSWKAGSIGWHADKDTKRIVTPWIEAVFAYGMVGLVGLYFLAVAGHFIWGSGADNKWGMPVAYGIGGMYLGMCWMANRFMLWPRRVALRIRRIAGETI